MRAPRRRPHHYVGGCSCRDRTRTDPAEKVFGRFGGLAVSRYVSDDDHIPAKSPEEPVRGLGRGLLVGGYEGLRAGEAIAAVRLLGLRPCLERVEGCEAGGLHGFVVSQEPSGGAEVAPDSQVFLYVASPARTVVGSAPGGPSQAAVVEASDDVGDEDEAREGNADDEGTFGRSDGQEDFPEDASGREVGSWVGDDDLHEAPAPHDEEDPDGEGGFYDAGDDDRDGGDADEFDGFGASRDEETRDLDPAGGMFASSRDGAEDTDGFVDEPVGPVRVWRGGLPGALPRRRPSSRRRSRRGVWRRLPLSVQLAVVALLAVAALVVLVSFACSVDSSSRGAGRPRPSLSGARPGGARTTVVPSPVVVARPVVAPSVSSARARRLWARRVGGRARTAIPSRSPAVPTPTSVTPAAPAPSPPGEPGAGSSEEHAIREFGP